MSLSVERTIVGQWKCGWHVPRTPEYKQYGDSGIVEWYNSCSCVFGTEFIFFTRPSQDRLTIQFTSMNGEWQAFVLGGVSPNLPENSIFKSRPQLIPMKTF